MGIVTKDTELQRKKTRESWCGSNNGIESQAGVGSTLSLRSQNEEEGKQNQKQRKH